jgi:hypothetical protein
VKAKLNSLPITAESIVEVLDKKHAKDICFDELRLSSGFANLSRVDFFAINVAPSSGNVAIAYEIKVSRADFKRDSAKKQRGARLFSDHFYYIAPAGVINIDDIPDWAGLMEVDWATSKYMNGGKPYLKIKTLLPAPKRDKDAPTWGLLVSMIRNARRRN